MMATQGVSATLAFLAHRDSTVDSLEEFFVGREAQPPTAVLPEVGFHMANAACQSSYFQYPHLTHARVMSDASTAASTSGDHTEPVTPDLSDNESEPHAAKL